MVVESIIYVSLSFSVAATDHLPASVFDSHSICPAKGIDLG